MTKFRENRIYDYGGYYHLIIVFKENKKFFAKYSHIIKYDIIEQEDGNDFIDISKNHSDSEWVSLMRRAEKEFYKELSYASNPYLLSSIRNITIKDNIIFK